MKYYMGISALHHDSSVALIDDAGNILSISHEERRTKIKNDKSWPQNSIDWCIRDAQVQGHNITLEDINFGYYEKPWSKFTRRVYGNPKKIKKFFDEALIPAQKLKNFKTINHHKAHAIAGCSTAPFDNGVYLTMDAIGEWDTTTWGIFNHKTGIKQHGNILYPNSLGLLYSSFTRWLGLKPLEDEYIVMGAAAYGKPIYAERIFEEFIELSKNGTFFLKKNIHNGVEQYLGNKVPTNQWFNWCASIQKVCEDTVMHLMRLIESSYGKNLNLVLSGGIALNCVVNSKILRNFSIDNIWILPSPGDSGNALGAAVHVAGIHKLNWTNAFLGNDIDNYSNPTLDLIRNVVGRLERGEVIGWIQGREEFGPRALGHRSLICDPRNKLAKERVNKIKHRQEFRPFAPSVLEENAFSYFDMIGKPEMHRYMQFVSRVRNPDLLPAICHIDNTARVQTVPKSTDSFRRLLEHWHIATNCAVLLNTSLNINGQPLISDRKTAIKMLLDNPMDCLVIGNRIYHKEEKLGLNEDNSPVTIVNYNDYSNGADNIIVGKW